MKWKENMLIFTHMYKKKINSSIYLDPSVIARRSGCGLLVLLGDS